MRSVSATTVFQARGDKLNNSYVTSLGVDSNGVLFAGTYGGGVNKILMNAGTWTQVNNGITNLFITSLVVKNSLEIYAGANDGKMFVTIDGGSTWYPTLRSVSNSPINCIIYSSLNCSGIYNIGDVFAGTKGGLFHSGDRGANWQLVISCDEIKAGAVNSKGKVVAGGDGYLFFSNDNGTTWSNIAESLPVKSILSLAITDEGNIFAGTSKAGVFMTADYGQSWQQINTGLANPCVNTLYLGKSIFGLYDGVNGYLFAGTNGDGVFQSVNQVSTAITEHSAAERTYKLSQNYPNPFNPETVIKYSVSSQGYTTLKMFNLLGKEIATLADEYKHAGDYEVKFSGVNLPSGVYFYTLRSGNFSETKKLMLIK